MSDLGTWLPTIVTIGGAIVTVAFGYGKLTSKVDERDKKWKEELAEVKGSNSKEIKEVKETTASGQTRIEDALRGITFDCKRMVFRTGKLAERVARMEGVLKGTGGCSSIEIPEPEEEEDNANTGQGKNT